MLQRNITIDDVGNVAAFLLSDLAAGVTAGIVVGTRPTASGDRTPAAYNFQF